MYKSKYTLCFLLISFILVLADNNSVHAGIDLKLEEPQLCYECHEKLKQGLTDNYTHFMFKQGKCSACHNPHASDHKGIIKDEINSVCLSCHEGLSKLLKNANLHGPLRDGECIDCHKPNSGENKRLLVNIEKELCWNCHESLKEQSNRTYSHTPFNEGNCSSCHDPHASVEENLLIGASIKICSECHVPLHKGDEVSKSFVTKEGCTTCHSGHSSDNKGLLGPYGHASFLNRNCEDCHRPFEAGKEIATKMKGEYLCFSCHKKEAFIYSVGANKNTCALESMSACSDCHDNHASESNDLNKKEPGLCIKCHEKTEKRTAHMERALKGIKCAPVKERECFACHVPLHSAEPLYYSPDATTMCANCHEAEHEITHPMGPNVIDPRNNQPVTCISCHSMHSARAKYMLTFDGKRRLCIECHKM